MNSYPLISIIIPTKNEQHNIERCLKSIKRQKYSGKLEIIVVDNFSEDKTVKLAKKITKKIFLQGPERSSQRNFGAQIAKGKYLLFIDADMELKSNTISECLKISQISPNYPIAIKEFSLGTTFWGKALALERNCYHDAAWLLGARFFSRKAFLELGGYDPKLIAAEDWDLTLRFAKKGCTPLTTPTPLIIHHESKESLIKLLQKELYYINNIPRYQAKHPKAFSFQKSFYYRITIWISNWKKLITHPVLTGAFLWYKFMVWLMWRLYKHPIITDLFS